MGKDYFEALLLRLGSSLQVSDDANQSIENVVPNHIFCDLKHSSIRFTPWSVITHRTLAFSRTIQTCTHMNTNDERHADQESPVKSSLSPFE